MTPDHIYEPLSALREKYRRDMNAAAEQRMRDVIAWIIDPMAMRWAHRIEDSVALTDETKRRINKAREKAGTIMGLCVSRPNGGAR